VFTARYALSPYIKRTCFVFKRLRGQWKLYIRNSKMNSTKRPMYFTKEYLQTDDEKKAPFTQPRPASTFLNPFFLWTLTTILITGVAVAVAFTNKINELVTWVHKYVVNGQKINDHSLHTVEVTTVQSFHKIQSPCPIAIWMPWNRMWSSC
jgi:hypothetical protein